MSIPSSSPAGSFQPGHDEGYSPLHLKGSSYKAHPKKPCQGRPIKNNFVQFPYLQPSARCSQASSRKEQQGRDNASYPAKHQSLLVTNQWGKCPTCNRVFKRLDTHFRTSDTCKRSVSPEPPCSAQLSSQIMNTTDTGAATLVQLQPLLLFT